MGAAKNRFTKKDVVRIDGADLVAWVSHDLRVMPIMDLSGGEARTACAWLFGSNNVASATLPQRLCALLKGEERWLGNGYETVTLDEAQAMADWVNDCKDYPEAPSGDAPSGDAPSGDEPPASMAELLQDDPQGLLQTPHGVLQDDQPDPTPMAGSPEDKLRIAQELFGAEVDYAKIFAHTEAYVAAKVAAELKELKPTVVKVGDGPEEKITGMVHFQFEKVLKAAHVVSVLLTGPAGTGKSKIMEQVAEGLGVPFGELSLDPSMDATALKGYMDAMGNYVATEFRRIYDADGDGGFWNMDEIDAGHPGILKAQNAALSAGWYSFPDGRVQRHENFRFGATANTWGNGASRSYVGGVKQDASVLDRYTAKFAIDYDRKMETTLAEAVAGQRGADWAETVHRIRKNQQAAGLEVVVSTRAVLGGARLINQGFRGRELYDLVLGEPLSTSDNEKLLKEVNP